MNSSGQQDSHRKTMRNPETVPWMTMYAREKHWIPCGRRVEFQCMDGQANYVVTHLLKNDKVVVQWINYDEDYIDDRLGDKGVLDLEYVLNITTWQDQLEGIRTSKTDA